MKTKLNVRQICFIMFAYTAVTKLFTYPAGLSFSCGRDLLFPALIDFLIEGVMLWCVAFLCSKTDKTFFALLKDSLGNICARIIYGLFAIVFLLSALLPILEQKLYVHTVFYDTLPSLSVFLPFFIFSIYAGGKQFQNIGRCADFCMPIFIVTIAVLFGMSVGEVRFDNLLPVLQTPAKNIFTSAAGGAFRFANPCRMLMFMGHFDYKKGTATKVTLSFAGGALTVLAFLAVYYGIYGDLTPSLMFAVSRISIFFPAIETIGRLDLIMLYILEIVLLFAVVLDIQLAVHSVSVCSGFEKRTVISVLLNLILVAVTVFCNHYFNSIRQVYYDWLWIVFVIFAVLVPALSWALRRRKNEKA